MTKPVLDEGYYFGMGVFETIAVEQGEPLFLEAHIQRLEKGLSSLHVTNPMATPDYLSREILKVCQTLTRGRYGLKLSVSKKNISLTSRPNRYQKKDYQDGYTTALSPILRNETSPFTFVKSLNYGDCILAKRMAKEASISEPIFQNTKGNLSEGAVSNVFLLKKGVLYTPSTLNGLLPGIMRSYLMTQYCVVEDTIPISSLCEYDEMFLTNSLMGIMPVSCFQGHFFSSMKYGKDLARAYFRHFQIPLSF